MKLEYLECASPNQKPVLLLYGADFEVLRSLAAVLSNLPEGGVEISTFPGVEAIDHCRVLVRPSTREAGIRRTGRNTFTWTVTDRALDHILGFMGPFTEPSTAKWFQWLEESGEIDFIVSRGRYC